MANASVVAELILRARDRTAQAFDALQRRLRDVDRQANRVNAVERRFSAVDAAVGRASTAVAGFAVVGAGVGMAKSITAAADFESSLTDIQKLAGTSAEETAKLGEEIKELATSGELAVPIEEIAAAYQRGAAAGIPIAELREFAARSVMAADAFGMSAEAVGNFSAKLATSLGMSKAEIKEVFDLTNALADSGIANESDIVDFMDRTGASLKTLGLSKEQTLALGSTLLNIGMTSEVAATGMDALSTRILTVSQLTGDKRKTFEKYMGSIEDFAGIVKDDANEALLTMLDTLKGLDKTDRMAFLSSFVGQDHASKMLRLAEATDEYRRNLALAADETRWFGSLEKSYQLKLDDFWPQWQVTKNAIEELAIDLGTMAMPGLKSGLEEARDVIAEIGKELETFSGLIDPQALAEAQESVANLGEAIAAALNINTEGSAIGQFAKDFAQITNDLMTAVGYADNALSYLNDPLGLGAPGDVDENGKPIWRESDALPGLERIREGSPADWLGENVVGPTGDAWSSFSEWADGRNETLKSMPEEEGPIWEAPAPSDLQNIGNRFADQGGSGWSGGGFEEGRGVTSGPPGFTPGRGVTTGGPGEVAVEADELRAALDQGNADLAQSGQQAGASIQQGGDAVAAAVAAAFASGANQVAASIRAALAQGVKVTMPASRPLLPSEMGTNIGRSMPNAGRPGSGAEGVRR